MEIDDLCKLIAKNLPSTMAQDSVWRSDGEFDLNEANWYSANEWREMARAILRALGQDTREP